MTSSQLNPNNFTIQKSSQFQKTFNCKSISIYICMYHILENNGIPTCTNIEIEMFLRKISFDFDTIKLVDHKIDHKKYQLIAFNI
jgi:hypothetical protein